MESEDNPSRADCKSNASSNSTTCSKSSGNRNAEGTLPDDNQDEIDVVTENVVDSAGNQVNETRCAQMPRYVRCLDLRPQNDRQL